MIEIKIAPQELTTRIREDRTPARPLVAATSFLQLAHDDIAWSDRFSYFLSQNCSDDDIKVMKEFLAKVERYKDDSP